MGRNPSWDANSCSSSEEIPYLLCSLPCWQKPAAGPYPDPNEYSPQPFFFMIFLILSPLIHICFSSDLFFSLFFSVYILYAILICPMYSTIHTSLIHLDFIVLITYLLTELRPSSGAANCAATQEVPSNLWNPKVHYRVHKSPPLVPIPS
jgi:hypothetical protein